MYLIQFRTTEFKTQQLLPVKAIAERAKLAGGEVDARFKCTVILNAIKANFTYI